jgi:hypothetical protein
MNRVEFLIEKRNQDYRMYIDGDTYANMLAVGWQQPRARQYRYEFIPTQVGCAILIHRISTGEIFDLTKDFDW